METSLIIAPSILACDFSDLGREAARLEGAGADWLHLDIMDGNFVDNISFGPAVVAAVKAHTTLPIDVHLMIAHPDHYLERFMSMAHCISIHVEAAPDPSATLARIRKGGVLAGLAISPDTSFDRVLPFLGEIDLLLVMTVRPGFGGQKFMPETLEKVAAAAEWKRRNGGIFPIEVDGGITDETAVASRRSGATVFVAGTFVCKAQDAGQAIRALRESGDGSAAARASVLM